jgi:hypothetical protein
MSLIQRYQLHHRLRNHLISMTRFRDHHLIKVLTNLFSFSLASSNQMSLIELISMWRVCLLQGHLANELGVLLPTVVLPLCRSCIQQMPNGSICRILIELLSLIDVLIIHIVKFIHQHR